MFRIAPVVLFAASLCSVAAAQDPAAGTVLDDGTVVLEPKPAGSATLKMSVTGTLVQAHVHSSEPGFVGVFGLSLTQNLTNSFGLPPLLTGGVVMAFGATSTQDLDLKALLPYLPSEPINLFGQALVIDERGFWSSNVVGLTIGGKDDRTEPAKGLQVNADQPAAH